MAALEGGNAMSLSSPTPRPTGSATGVPAEQEPSQQLPATPTPPPPELPLRRSRRGRRLAKPGETETLTGAQRLLLLDTWRRSGLPAGDFAPRNLKRRVRRGRGESLKCLLLFGFARNGQIVTVPSVSQHCGIKTERDQGYENADWRIAKAGDSTGWQVSCISWRLGCVAGGVRSSVRASGSETDM